MKWTCEYCCSQVSVGGRSRHMKIWHPENYQKQSNKGNSICPICKKIMHKTHVKRHMIRVHKADEGINVGQIRKENIMTNFSYQDFPPPKPLSLPLYWIYAFIVIDRLLKLKKYVQLSDVITSTFKFLRKIGFLQVHPFKEFIEYLECYGYIKNQVSARILDDEDKG